jgi:hypothetical protein
MASNALAPTPTSYTELFDMYADYLQGLLIRMGCLDPEDGAMEIFMKFIEQDFLTKYNPDFTLEVEGKTHRTSFQGFFTRFAKLYWLQIRDRQITKARKEPVQGDSPVGDGSDSWHTVFGPVGEDPSVSSTDTMSLLEAIDETKAYLRALPIRGKRDLSLVFDMVLQQMADEGRVNRAAIAKALEVSPTAVCLIFKDLRVACEEAGLKDALIGAA